MPSPEGLKKTKKYKKRVKAENQKSIKEEKEAEIELACPRNTVPVLAVPPLTRANNQFMHTQFSILHINLYFFLCTPLIFVELWPGVESLAVCKYLLTSFALN